LHKYDISIKFKNIYILNGFKKDMKERGIVVRQNKTGIDVQLLQRANCDGCSACFIDPDKRHIMRIIQDIKVNPGQEVEVEVHPGYAIKSALLLFLLPLIMLIGGYYFFSQVLTIPILKGEYGGIAGALLSFTGTYVFVFMYDRRLKKGAGGEKVRIVRVFQDYKILEGE
jgi:positive regulator of sigma E activity